MTHELEGDMIYLEALGEKMVVLHSLSNILPLLETKATNNSDRLLMPAWELWVLFHFDFVIWSILSEI